MLKGKKGGCKNNLLDLQLKSILNFLHFYILKMDTYWSFKYPFIHNKTFFEKTNKLSTFGLNHLYQQYFQLQ